MGQLSGVVLVDKPVGPTSHGVVAAVRRAAGQKRVGHAGTLDPLASGLLLVLLGSATRLAEYLVGHDKQYAVEARLGVQTDTYDAEGTVTSHWEGQMPTDDEIDSVVSARRGQHWQEPPAYSAVKVHGQPLHRLARRGVPGRAAPRLVHIHSLEWSRPCPDTLVLQVACSAGTYIRSLVHDIGLALGCGAHVSRLRRTHSGPFSVEQALSLEETCRRLADGDAGLLLDPVAALPHIPIVRLGAAEVERVRLGQAVPGPDPARDGIHLVLDESAQAVAVACWDEGESLWRPRKVLSQENAL